MKLRKESGVIRKRWRGRIPIALVFPNVYHVGMSNLGFRLVYHFLNSYKEIVCERLFLPQEGEDLRSIESNRPLKDFKIVLFSVSFESDFVNVVRILELGGFPPLAEQRQEGPLILAGGVGVWLNPDPLAPFVDGFLIGEIESLGAPLVEKILESSDKKDLKERLKEVPGFLASDAYEPAFDHDGFIKEFYQKEQDLPVKKVIAKDLLRPPFSDLLAEDTEFSKTYLIEVGRGCGRGCRFCAAGMLYRPPRPWGIDVLQPALDQILHKSKVGLIGLEFSNYEVLESIAEFLIQKDCILTFSSLRADLLTPNFVKLLSRQKTATIAPEAGSDRLRRVINKGLCEDDILNAAILLAQAGIKQIKLYFMIGLPTETQEDVEAILVLSKKIKHVVDKITKLQRYVIQIKLSVASFVPKPWTPFQWASFTKRDVLKKRLSWLRKKISKSPNMQLTSDLPKWAYLQALIARGDRRLKPLLLALAKGKTLSQALVSLPVNPDFFVYREREKHEIFPWEVLDLGIKRSFLWEEWGRAQRGQSSPPCVLGKCKRCGVC